MDKQDLMESEAQAEQDVLTQGHGDLEEQGKKNPGQTSEEELEKRVELVLKMLISGYRKSLIKTVLKQRYGVTARTVENYLSRAKQILLLELKEERDDQCARSLAFYRSVLSDATAKTKDKINAQRRIDLLLGLQAPTRVALTDPEGNTPAAPTIQVGVDLSGLSTDELIQLRGIRQKVNGSKVGSN